MLTIIIVLVVLWALGMLTGYALGGLLHALLVIAVVLWIVQTLTNRGGPAV